MPSTSEARDAHERRGRAVANRPAIALEDVWLGFKLRFYRKRLTIRGTAISALSSLVRRGRRRDAESFWALRGLDLTVHHGEVLGIIGANGAGKSTLLRVMAGIYAPDRGRVRTEGRISTLLSFGAGFDLRRPGRENVSNNGVLLGMTGAQIQERMPAIVEMAGIGDFIDAPVMTYSSGMRARLGFSVAVNVDSDIILIDEVLGAGDERFRHRVGTVFDQLAREDKTIVFVTHSMEAMTRYCARAIWMDQGRVRMGGEPADVAAEYMQASQGAG